MIDGQSQGNGEGDKGEGDKGNGYGDQGRLREAVVCPRPVHSGYCCLAQGLRDRSFVLSVYLSVASTTKYLPNFHSVYLSTMLICQLLMAQLGIGIDYTSFLRM